MFTTFALYFGLTLTVLAIVATLTLASRVRSAEWSQVAVIDRAMRATMATGVAGVALMLTFGVILPAL